MSEVNLLRLHNVLSQLGIVTASSHRSNAVLSTRFPKPRQFAKHVQNRIVTDYAIGA
jgi:hypothetical protein